MALRLLTRVNHHPQSSPTPLLSFLNSRYLSTTTFTFPTLPPSSSSSTSSTSPPRPPRTQNLAKNKQNKPRKVETQKQEADNTKEKGTGTRASRRSEFSFGGLSLPTSDVDAAGIRSFLESPLIMLKDVAPSAIPRDIIRYVQSRGGMEPKASK